MNNPLAILAEQMGLGANFLAAKSGLAVADVESALSADPPKPISDYIRLMGVIGAKMRILAAPPLTISIENRAIDALIKNNDWRREVGLCCLPRNRRQLYELVALLRARNLTSQQTADYLQRHFIPGASGRATWSSSMVEHIIERSPRKSTRAGPLVHSREAWRADFRRYVVAELMARCFPEDPAASLRYKMEPEFDADRVIIRTTGTMPACVQQWIIEEWRRRLRWFPSGAFVIATEDAAPTPLSSVQKM